MTAVVLGLLHSITSLSAREEIFAQRTDYLLDRLRCLFARLVQPKHAYSALAKLKGVGQT